MTCDGVGDSHSNRDPSLLKQILRVCQPLYKPMMVALPLIALNRGAALTLPLATKVLVDDILVSRRVDLLWMFLWATVAAALVQGATIFGVARVLGHAHERLVAVMRTRLQAHIVSLPLLFHESAKTGSLISSIMMDTEGFSKLFSAGVGDAGAAVLGALVAFVFLLHIEPTMACGALVLVVTHTILSEQLGRRVLAEFRDHRRTKAEVVGRLMETLAGVRLVKVYDAERHESDVFRAGAWQVCREFMSATLHSEALRAVSLAITGVGTATLLFVGASKVLAGELTIGGLVAFNGTLVLLVAPINQVAGLVARLPQALAEVERTLRLLSEPSESATSQRRVRMLRIRGNVTFDHVSFAYLPQRPVLHDVSFEVDHGAVIAFVGASGAGKSTIAALVASLYEPTQGRILVDGIDCSTVSFASYRSQVGMVLQDTFLFDGSILQNVAFSRRDVPESKIVAACRIARVADFAERLPEGYHTRVGERGVRLSGGERQRIAIARALLIDPRILILDEPTSSLDYDAEEGIVASLKELIAGRTTFIISHRPSLVEIADRVLFVDNGRLVDEGTRLDGHLALAHSSNPLRAGG